MSHGLSVSRNAAIMHDRQAQQTTRSRPPAG